MGICTAASYCYSFTPQNHLRLSNKLLLSWMNNHHHGRVKMRSAAAAATWTTSATTPWLMLPPVVEGGGAFNYKFYSLEEEKVLSFSKRRCSGGGDEEEIPPDDAKIVGSSHGWLALFDEKSNHVFLSDPISDRHVKLPAIDTLPDPHINLFEGRGTVSRVVISGPPPLGQEEEKEKEKEWSAVMTFGLGGRPAQCSGAPGPGATWQPMERAFQPYEPQYEHVKFAMRPYHDLVHRTGTYFTMIQPCTFDLRNHGGFARDRYGRGEKHCEMVHWQGGAYAGDTHVCSFDALWKEMNVNADVVEMLEKECIQMPHLVWAESICDSNPLIVMRFVNRGIGIVNHGVGMDQVARSKDLSRARLHSFPHSTVFFLVLKIDRGEIKCEVVDDLKGLALFVGINNALAIPATTGTKLKPNSIYFTDAESRIFRPDADAADDMMIYGDGRDVGIFDYHTMTISPFNFNYNYPSCDFNFNRMIWFTPSSSTSTSTSTSNK